MKKSRLNLFRVTSMTISILGVIMIIATIVLFAYFGIDQISKSISGEVDSGSAYDDLAVLKSDYNALKVQFDAVKVEVNQGSDQELKKKYIAAELELVKAQSDIEDVESALSTDKSASEVQSRLEAAQVQLQTAKESLASIRAQM